MNQIIAVIGILALLVLIVAMGVWWDRFSHRVLPPDRNSLLGRIRVFIAVYLFTINRFYGWSINFRFGFHIGFNWTHGNGHSSRTSACIAGYHPPSSITWLWALYWAKPPEAGAQFSYVRGFRNIRLGVPLIGSFSLTWQKRLPYDWRKRK